ncbi:transmembrane protein, putative [Medicago truncatula]|uniref:Transmembrane protein, putative n=1 Tax=Medicago truncatula TaxID=3880 RepID=A0A072V872_MEDTR|nr:transmembrane protein, putative [Medicago truncatula]
MCLLLSSTYHPGGPIPVNIYLLSTIRTSPSYSFTLLRFMVLIISYVLNIQKNDYYFLLGHKRESVEPLLNHNSDTTVVSRGELGEPPTRKQPHLIKAYAVLAGKNGPAKQEQQKRFNAGQPNLTLLLILICPPFIAVWSGLVLHPRHPLEHDPDPPAAEAAPNDPHTNAADTHQNDTVEAPYNKADFAPADTPDNAADNVSDPPYGIDPSVMIRPPQHQPYQVSCPQVLLSLDQPKESVPLASPSVHY